MSLISGPSGDRQILPGRRPFFPGETEIHHRNHGTTRDDDPTQNRTRVGIYAALWAIPGVFRDRNWFRTPEDNTNPVVPKIGIDWNPQKKAAQNPKIPKKNIEMKNLQWGKSTFRTKKCFVKKWFCIDSEIFFQKKIKNFPNLFPKNFLIFFKNVVDFFEIFSNIFFEHFLNIFSSVLKKQKNGAEGARKKRTFWSRSACFWSGNLGFGKT